MQTMSPTQMLRTTAFAALMLAMAGPAISEVGDCDPNASTYVITISEGSRSGTCSIQIVDRDGNPHDKMTVWRDDVICVQNRWSVWKPVRVDVKSEDSANGAEALHGGTQYTFKKGWTKRLHTNLVVQEHVQEGEFKYVFSCAEKESTKDAVRPFATPRYIIVEPPPDIGQGAPPTDPA